MKQAQSPRTAQPNSKGSARADNKDNIDSRHKEEEMVKKNHSTTNEKEHRSQGKKQNQK